MYSPGTSIKSSHEKGIFPEGSRKSAGISPRGGPYPYQDYTETFFTVFRDCVQEKDPGLLLTIVHFHAPFAAGYYQSLKNYLFMLTSTAIRDCHEERDFHSLQQIRHKFQEVFGNRCTMGNDVLRKRYRISPEVYLIMIIG